MAIKLPPGEEGEKIQKILEEWKGQGELEKRGAQKTERYDVIKEWTVVDEKGRQKRHRLVLEKSTLTGPDERQHIIEFKEEETEHHPEGETGWMKTHGTERDLGVMQ